jgi:uncharacterized membrane protein YeaQ/YmgE (transglycosylase-associated protein family)
MGLLVAIILGALVGWLASRMLGRDEGILMSVVIGVIGSFIGSLISKMFTGSDQSFLSFSWVGLLWSLAGALILVALMNAITHRTHHQI